MDTLSRFDEQDRDSIELLKELIAAAGPALSRDEVDNKWAAVRCGELDSAIEGMIDLSGAMHWYAIPRSLESKIKRWLDSLGVPGPDDDDYPWYAAKRALDYSRSQETVTTESHTIPVDLPEPEYDLVEKKAASSGTSAQELVTSWVKERIGELSYA